MRGKLTIEVFIMDSVSKGKSLVDRVLGGVQTGILVGSLALGLAAGAAKINASPYDDYISGKNVASATSNSSEKEETIGAGKGVDLGKYNIHVSQEKSAAQPAQPKEEKASEKAEEHKIKLVPVSPFVKKFLREQEKLSTYRKLRNEASATYRFTDQKDHEERLNLRRFFHNDLAYSLSLSQSRDVREKGSSETEDQITRDINASAIVSGFELGSKIDLSLSPQIQYGNTTLGAGLDTQFQHNSGLRLGAGYREQSTEIDRDLDVQGRNFALENRSNLRVYRLGAGKAVDLGKYEIDLGWDHLVQRLALENSMRGPGFNKKTEKDFRTDIDVLRAGSQIKDYQAIALLSTLDGQGGRKTTESLVLADPRLGKHLHLNDKLNLSNTGAYLIFNTGNQGSRGAKAVLNFAKYWVTKLELQSLGNEENLQGKIAEELKACMLRDITYLQFSGGFTENPRTDLSSSELSLRARHANLIRTLGTALTYRESKLDPSNFAGSKTRTTGLSLEGMYKRVGGELSFERTDSTAGDDQNRIQLSLKCRF